MFISTQNLVRRFTSKENNLKLLLVALAHFIASAASAQSLPAAQWSVNAKVIAIENSWVPASVVFYVDTQPIGGACVRSPENNGYLMIYRADLLTSLGWPVDYKILNVGATNKMLQMATATTQTVLVYGWNPGAATTQPDATHCVVQSIILKR
jgi:hypothetical protein